MKSFRSASSQSGETVLVQQRHAGDEVPCPDCKTLIKLQPSACTCRTCRDTLYIPEHRNSKGKHCPASSHGWKVPDLVGRDLGGSPSTGRPEAKA